MQCGRRDRRPEGETVTRSPDTLILGWGNPGRGDDGLGPELVRVIGERGLPGVVTDSDYQLQIENGAQVARYRRVVFVDADRTGAEPFWLDRLLPQDGGWTFSTHSVSPATVLALARDLFQAEPEAWLLGIRGYEFDEFHEQLSTRARSNLDEAVEFLTSAVRGGGMREIRRRAIIKSTINDHEGEPCQTTSP